MSLVGLQSDKADSWKNHSQEQQWMASGLLIIESSLQRLRVRYIHLNPLRAGLVSGLQELSEYAWCEDGVLLGKRKSDWQDRDYVLGWFGRKERESRAA